MGAAGSVGSPAEAAAAEAAEVEVAATAAAEPSKEPSKEEAAAAAEALAEAARASTAKKDRHKAHVYDACVAPFVERLASKPVVRSAPAKPSSSLFAAPEAPARDADAESAEAEKEAKAAAARTEARAGMPYYDELSAPARSELLTEIGAAGRSAELAVGDGSDEAYLDAAHPLAFKSDVYDLVFTGDAVDEEADVLTRVRKMDTVREIVVAATVAATRLTAAMRGRQERIALAKKGKKTKKPKGKKKKK